MLLEESLQHIVVSNLFQTINTVLSSGIALYIIKESINKKKKQKEQLQDKDPLASIAKKEKLRSIEEFIYLRLTGKNKRPKIIAPWYFTNGTYTTGGLSIKKMHLADESFNDTSVQGMINQLQDIKVDYYERLLKPFRDDPYLKWYYSDETKVQDGLAATHKECGGNHIYIFPVRHLYNNILVGLLVLKFEEYPDLSEADIEYLEIQTSKMWDCII